MTFSRSTSKWHGHNLLMLRKTDVLVSTVAKRLFDGTLVTNGREPQPCIHSSVLRASHTHAIICLSLGPFTFTTSEKSCEIFAVILCYHDKPAVFTRIFELNYSLHLSTFSSFNYDTNLADLIDVDVMFS